MAVFNQLPEVLELDPVVSVGVDIGSDAVTPTPQAGELSVSFIISAWADPGAAGAAAAIVRTRVAGATEWMELTSSRENEVTGNGAYSITVVDPILDEVQLWFDVAGQTFSAAPTFLSDAILA